MSVRQFTKLEENRGAKKLNRQERFAENYLQIGTEVKSLDYRHFPCFLLLREYLSFSNRFSFHTSQLSEMIPTLESTIPSQVYLVTFKTAGYNVEGQKLNTLINCQFDSDGPIVQVIVFH